MLGTNDQAMYFLCSFSIWQRNIPKKFHEKKLLMRYLKIEHFHFMYLFPPPKKYKFLCFHCYAVLKYNRKVIFLIISKTLKSTMKDSKFFFGMTRYHSQSSDFFRDFSADVISSGNVELAEKSFCKSK